MAFRFSGHETFPCRYAWLPKAFAQVAAGPAVLDDDESAMIALGVGKNMVRSIRFWIVVAGVARRERDGVPFAPTEFGQALLAPKGGLDPFLEDAKTLWLLHWKIAGQMGEPLFAWDYLFNRWPHPEFTRSAVAEAFAREARLHGKRLSAVTLEQHLDVFLHTYTPTRGRKGMVQEDNLDCPFVELGLIQKAGERGSPADGRPESVYAFRYEEKPDVTPELFAYCLDDFWRRRFPDEQTLTLRDVSLAPGSPGRLFKLSDADVRARLDRIEAESGGRFAFRESAAREQVVRPRGRGEPPPLAYVYRQGG